MCSNACICVYTSFDIILEAVMALDRPSLGIPLDKTHESCHEDTTDVRVIAQVV